MNMKRLFIIIATVIIFSLFFISCYYDNEEVLYPSFRCDSINVTYSRTIAPMMNNYCTGCHSGSSPQGSISLTTYEEVVAYAPRITVSIKQTGQYPMPKGGGKLNDCTLRQWDIWLIEKMP
jgi:hypothetical protein